MRGLLFVCVVLLLIAVANMPIGYYTFLRITITIGAIAVVIKELDNGINFWVIIFGGIAILFNPIFPIYLNEKESWIPIDIIAVIIFGIKALTLKSNTND